HLPSHERVTHDVLVLLVRERTWLVEHRLAHADLPDVVHMSAKLDLTHHLVVEPERARNHRRVLTHAHRMTARVRIFQLECLGERLNAGEKELLEPSRLSGDALLQLLLIVAVLEDEPPPVER